MEKERDVTALAKTIFLAEDDQDDVMLFQSALAGLEVGYRLEVFCNGQELLNKLAKISGKKPDFIFLDINMPIKNGLETLTEIRNKISGGIPVFLLSTANDRVNVEMARKSGATGYLSKSSSAAELTQMLQNVLAVDWQQRSVNDFYVHIQFQTKATSY